MIAGTLEVQMMANMARLQKDMTAARTTVSNTMGRINKSVGTVMKSLGALALGIGVIGFARMVKGSLQAQDAFAKLSEKVGISVVGLVGLKHAAEQSGVSFEGLQKGIKTVASQMFDASMGLLESQRNFRALGIEIKDTTGGLKGAEAVLIEVADKFAAMKDSTEKTALSVKLFGKAGLDMIPMLNMGSAALARLVKEGQELNPTTAESAAQAVKLNDNMDRLTKAVKGTGTALLIYLLPRLSETAEAMEKARKSGDGFFGTLIAGWRTLVTGTDRDKFAAQVKAAQLELANANREQAKWEKILSESGGNERAKKELANAQALVYVAKERLSTLAGIKDILFGIEVITKKKGEGTTADVDDVKLKAEQDAQLQQDIQFARQFQDRQDIENGYLDASLQLNEDYGAAERAKLKEHYDLRNKILIEAYDRDQQESVAAGEAQIAIDAAVAAAKKTEQEQQLAQTHTFLGSVAGLMNTESKRQFKIGKAAALAETAMNTYAAAMGAYKALSSIYLVGPALGAAAAAAVTLSGAAQMSKINATEIGGANTVGSFPASPTTGQPVGTPGGDVGRNSQTTIYNLTGESFSRAQVRKLLEAQNENAVDGSRMVVVEH